MGWEAKKTSKEGAGVLSRVQGCCSARKETWQAPWTRTRAAGHREGCGVIARSETVRFVFRSGCSREQLGTSGSLITGTMSPSSLVLLPSEVPGVQKIVSA